MIMMSKTSSETITQKVVVEMIETHMASIQRATETTETLIAGDQRPIVRFMQ